MSATSRTGILLLSRTLCIGGAELVIANLARHLDPDRFDVHVGFLTEKGQIGEELAAENFKVVGLQPPSFPGGSLLSFLALRKYVRQHRIRLVHTHGTAALVEGALCRGIHSGARLIHTFHFGNYPDQTRGNLRLERLFWKMPDRLIAVGRRQCEAIRGTYGIPTERISTVANGVTLTGQSPDRELLAPYLDSGKVLVGSISTMIEQKGIPDLLEVAARVRAESDKVMFLIIGDGPLRGELEARRDALGLQDSVHFLGWVKNAAATVLPVLDIFIQSSLWEAMSMVILEAMAAGRAIVATDVGDNRYMLDHGRTGFVLQPRDVTGMSDAVLRLVQDGDVRRGTGEAARADYGSRFTVESMARRYEEVYRETLTAGQAP